AGFGSSSCCVPASSPPGCRRAPGVTRSPHVAPASAAVLREPRIRSPRARSRSTAWWCGAVRWDPPSFPAPAAAPAPSAEVDPRVSDAIAGPEPARPPVWRNAAATVRRRSQPSRAGRRVPAGGLGTRPPRRCLWTDFRKCPARLDPAIDVEPSRAGCFGPPGQAEVIEDLTRCQRHLANLRPRHARYRVEIDAQLVRMVQVGGSHRMRIEVDTAEVD